MNLILYRLAPRSFLDSVQACLLPLEGAPGGNFRDAGFLKETEKSEQIARETVKFTTNGRT